jgi:putative glutamine transport system substrate-binding protein
MKKHLLVLLIVSVSLIAQAQLKGDTYASAKQKKSANVVYTYAEAPGFAAKDASGNVRGICVDLMGEFVDYVKTKHGISMTVSYKSAKPDDFTYFLNEVKTANGGVFGLSNTTITEERKKQYNFSVPYITNIGMILSNKSVQTVNKLSEIGLVFNGMTAVTVKNSTNEKFLLDVKSKYFPEMKIEYVASFGIVSEKILADSKKFANLDFTYYLDAIKTNKPIKRHPGGDSSAEKFGIIMPRSNDWAPILNEFMNSGFVGSVGYRKILSDNLGSNALKFLDNMN